MSDRTSSADRWLPWLLALATAAYLLPLRGYGLMMVDDGWYLQPVLRMRAGEILYRDIWTFYAPGIHHAVEWLFRVTGPSILAARTLLAAGIVVSVVLSYRLARRFAPPWLAWLPAAVYALVPGPWHKAYFATCTTAFFVLLARALERPDARRFAALGAMTGVTLVTRQDLGLLQLAAGLVAALLPAVWPTGFGRAARAPGPALRFSTAFLLAFAIPVAATAGYYAAHGALHDLLDATFVRAFSQAGAHPALLGRILSPASFAQAPEGRAVGVLMLLPLALYPTLAIALLARLRREGLNARNALVGALLAYATATLSQAYFPMLLLRFLQSALPFYLLATIAVADGVAALRARERFVLSHALVAATFGAATLLVGLVGFGLPAVRQPIYTGSLRMLRYRHPVEALSASINEDWGLAEEIRLVRAFFAGVPAGQPTIALPIHPLYNVLLDRPNPTRYVGDHPTGNFTMTAAQKQAEADRLLASPTRFAIVDQRWYARPTPPDPLLLALRDEFHPVRGYGTVLVLERGNDAEWRDFAMRLQRAIASGPAPGDTESWRRFVTGHADEPLAFRMLGLSLKAAGETNGAIAALHRAVQLDPTDVSSLETTAALLASLGRRGEAVSDIARARAVRESPAIRHIETSLKRTSDAPASSRHETDLSE
jgi:hypothetical protein